MNSLIWILLFLIPGRLGDIGQYKSYYPDILGGGWKLVRRVPRNNKWHLARDQLSGNHTYGEFHDNPSVNALFSRRFENEAFDQYLFATGDRKKWLVADREAVTGEFYEDQERQIVSSSADSNPYAAMWTRAEGAQGTPFVGLEDYHKCENNGMMLYAEQETTRGAAGVLQTNNGANVFIRQRAYKVYITGCCDYTLQTNIVPKGRVWADRSYKWKTFPTALEGGVQVMGPYRHIPQNSELAIVVTHPSVVYLLVTAAPDKRTGGFDEELPKRGWEKLPHKATWGPRTKSYPMDVHRKVIDDYEILPVTTTTQTVISVVAKRRYKYIGSGMCIGESHKVPCHFHKKGMTLHECQRECHFFQECIAWSSEKRGGRCYLYFDETSGPVLTQRLEHFTWGGDKECAGVRIVSSTGKPNELPCFTKLEKDDKLIVTVSAKDGTQQTEVGAYYEDNDYWKAEEYMVGDANADYDDEEEMVGDFTDLYETDIMEDGGTKNDPFDQNHVGEIYEEGETEELTVPGGLEKKLELEEKEEENDRKLLAMQHKAIPIEREKRLSLKRAKRQILHEQAEDEEHEEEPTDPERLHLVPFWPEEGEEIETTEKSEEQKFLEAQEEEEYAYDYEYTTELPDRKVPYGGWEHFDDEAAELEGEEEEHGHYNMTLPPREETTPEVVPPYVYNETTSTTTSEASGPDHVPSGVDYVPDTTTTLEVLEKVEYDNGTTVEMVMKDGKKVERTVFQNGTNTVAIMKEGDATVEINTDPDGQTVEVKKDPSGKVVEEVQRQYNAQGERIVVKKQGDEVVESVKQPNGTVTEVVKDTKGNILKEIKRDESSEKDRQKRKETRGDLPGRTREEKKEDFKEADGDCCDFNPHVTVTPYSQVWHDRTFQFRSGMPQYLIGSKLVRTPHFLPRGTVVTITVSRSCAVYLLLNKEDRDGRWPQELIKDGWVLLPEEIQWHRTLNIYHRPVEMEITLPETKTAQTIMSIIYREPLTQGGALLCYDGKLEDKEYRQGPAYKNKYPTRESCRYYCLTEYQSQGYSYVTTGNDNECRCGKMGLTIDDLLFETNDNLNYRYTCSSNDFSTFGWCTCETAIVHDLQNSCYAATKTGVYTLRESATPVYCDQKFVGGKWMLMATITDAKGSYSESVSPLTADKNPVFPCVDKPYSRDWRNLPSITPHQSDEFLLKRGETGEYVRFVVEKWCGWGDETENCLDSSHTEASFLATGQAYNEKGEPIKGATFFNGCALAGECAKHEVDGIGFGSNEGFLSSKGGGAYGIAAPGNFYWGEDNPDDIKNLPYTFWFRPSHGKGIDELNDATKERIERIANKERYRKNYLMFKSKSKTTDELKKLSWGGGDIPHQITPETGVKSRKPHRTRKVRRKSREEDSDEGSEKMIEVAVQDVPDGFEIETLEDGSKVAKLTDPEALGIHTLSDGTKVLPNGIMLVPDDDEEVAVGGRYLADTEAEKPVEIDYPEVAVGPPATPITMMAALAGIAGSVAIRSIQEIANRARNARGDMSDRNDHTDRDDRRHRRERAERNVYRWMNYRADRKARNEHAARKSAEDRTENAIRAEKAERADRSERLERGERNSRGGEIQEMSERLERGQRGERGEFGERLERQWREMRGERFDRAEARGREVNAERQVFDQHADREYKSAVMNAEHRAHLAAEAKRGKMMDRQALEAAVELAQGEDAPEFFAEADRLRARRYYDRRRELTEWV